MSKISFATRAGRTVHGELEGPDEGPAGGVVLIQEYWGLNAHIKNLTNRLARAGFYVLAPDLYHGKLAHNAKEASALMNELDTLHAVREIEGAVDLLRTLPGCNKKVGVIGFCLGGALSFASACHIADLAAVVAFYGVPQTDKVDYANVTAPIQAHFAADDRWASKEKAESIQAALAKRGASMELFTYDAPHAFMNDTRPEVYDPAAATLAWSRSVEFLNKHLP